MKLVHLEQGTLEWKRWRNDGLGGSDIANLMGLSPFEDSTPEDLLREKVHGSTRETSFAMRRGNRLEPVVRLMVSNQMPEASFAPVCVEHDECHWMRCSLDGLSICQTQILEIKCPAWHVHDWFLAGIVPPYYMVQMQWQMLVTGLDVCWAASFNDGKRFATKDHLALFRVEADAEQQAEIHDAGSAFWDRVEKARDVVFRE